MLLWYTIKYYTYLGLKMTDETNNCTLDYATDRYALMWMNGSIVFDTDPVENDTYTLTDSISGQTWNFVFVEDHWEIET